MGKIMIECTKRSTTIRVIDKLGRESEWYNGRKGEYNTMGDKEYTYSHDMWTGGERVNDRMDEGKDDDRVDEKEYD